MSQQKVLETLVKIGLRQPEAKVYTLLTKREAIKARDIAKALKMSKQQLYPIIKNLQRKGIVNASLERPARFSAVPLEKVLDFFVKAKIEQAQLIKQNKDELLSDWRLIGTESNSSPAKFTVIEGRSYIYAKIQQMAQNTKEHLSFVTTIPSLARAHQFGLFDTTFDHSVQSKIQFRFVTELSGQNINAVKTLLNRIPKRGFNLIGRTPDLGLKLCPRMVIRDAEETIFFIDEKRGQFATERDDVCLWTDCESLVRGFSTMFEELWCNATDIEKKIREIETNKPAPRTCIIRESEAAKTKYEQALDNAEKEILIMTSSAGLVDFWRNKPLQKECIARGISIRIMAPITGESLIAAQDLQKSCEVRHVATGYLETTTIDGKKLFQFKAPLKTRTNLESISHFENTFFTNDFEYVEKARNMLEDIWNKAHVPSTMTIESIFRQAVSANTPPKVHKLGVKKAIRKIKHNGFLVKIDKEASKTLTEKQVLHKAVSAEKIPAKDLFKEVSRMFTTWGLAVIDSPRVFNLPRMIITAIHIEKQSSLGEEDNLHISLWLKTPTGYGYVPVAFVNDRPDTADIWRKSFIGTPAEHNIQTVKKDEIQVRVHGNTLFAGWTVPIQLWPKSYILPPSCLLFEGYGKAKPGRGIMKTTAPVTNKLEYNSVEAFVTFMHPTTKYEGSGIEGILLRDCTIEVCPC